jgi:hypothetical protein
VKVITNAKEPFIHGSIAQDQKFKSLGPTGAILIGLEAKCRKFGHIDMVRAVRPIYRVGRREEFGTQYGIDLDGVKTLKAKDGYAVGAITGRAGWWCNGFSLTFMRIKPDGNLDPSDSYESEWIGAREGDELVRVTGEGTPVVGIVGKVAGAGPETTALGLLFRGQEGFDPAAAKP